MRWRPSRLSGVVAGRRSRLSSVVLALSAAAALLFAAPAAVAEPAVEHVGTVADIAGDGTTTAPDPGAILGGDTLYADGGRACDVGFNARRGTEPFALLSGDCVGTATTWYADPARTVEVGTTATSDFPGHGVALVRYTDTALEYPGAVRLPDGDTLRITGAAPPTVGASVCHVGPRDATRCGTILAVDVSVNYPEGTVSGLFQTDICAATDTGGPAVADHTALGVILADKDCATTGGTLYQPLLPVLQEWNLTLG